MALISVVIPVHNGAATLTQTLDSVRQQTHRDLEVLVIDDASTDATAALTKAFDDSRLRYHRVDLRNCGAARNAGIRLAQGEFLSFIDADDLWTPDKLEAQLAQLRREPDAGVAYSFTTHIGEDGTQRFEGYQGGDSGDVLRSIFRRYFLESGSNALIHRKVIEAIGVFEPSYRICADWDFFLRAAQHFTFACVPTSQILYRHRESTLSASGAGLRRECRQVLQEAIQRTPELRTLRPASMAVVDNHVLSKALKGRRSAATLGLVVGCLVSHARAGRLGWQLLQGRPAIAGYWLTEILAWLLLPDSLRQRRRQARIQRLTANISSSNRSS